MEQSKKRRKARARAVAFWEDHVRRALDDVRGELGQQPDAVIPDDLLVSEVLRLGHPEALPETEAVIPGGNVSLARAWLRARLQGEADTEQERRELARRIAPLPDEEPGGQQAWGLNRRVLERAIIYEAKQRGGLD